MHFATVITKLSALTRAASSDAIARKIYYQKTETFAQSGLAFCPHRGVKKSSKNGVKKRRDQSNPFYIDFLLGHETLLRIGLHSIKAASLFVTCALRI